MDGTAASAAAKADKARKPRRPLSRLLWAAVAALTVALALFLLVRVLRRYSLADIEASIAAIPPWRVAAAALCAVASYGMLSLFDALAVRYVGRRLPYRRIVLASFTALSIGHSIGFSAVSSGTLRYRFYSAWGLGAGDVARIVLFCGTTVAVGLGALASAALVAAPPLLLDALGGASPGQLRLLGAAGFVLIGLYVLLAALLRGRPLHIGRWWIAMPPLRLALGQVVVGGANFLLVAGVLYQTLAGAAPDIGYFSVAAAYAAASIAALIAHVPGGWGVLEAVVILLLPPEQDPVGALVVFRVVYYLVPFCLGVASLALSELIGRRRWRRGAAATTGSRLGKLRPQERSHAE
jgi:hypothetical protein